MKKTIIFFALIGLHSSISAQNNFKLEGTILERGSNTPIAFASVVLNSNQRGTCTDYNGAFLITHLLKETYRLQISCLGYQSIDTLIYIDNNKHITITLTPTTLALEGVMVTAQESKQNGTSTTISSTTMQHLQPNSLSEVMKLIPGNINQETAVNQANLLSLRQVGSDINTSLGASIIMDGVPISGDATLQDAHNGGDDNKIKNRRTTGKGIDLRQIPTDQIESIEVVRGIASAKYGEVTSGAVIIKQKLGETPYELRAKKDANTLLLHAGKGVKLGKSIFNGGIDYINSNPDPRKVFEQYQRLSASMRYQHSITGNAVRGRINGELSVTSTLDKEKDDPEEMTQAEDSYSASYTRLFARTGGSISIEESLIGSIDWNLAAAQVLEKTLRNRFVSPKGPMPLPISTKEGYSYGIYLPAEYQSNLEVNGKPLNLYAATNLALKEQHFLGKHTILLGAEYKFDWNHGNGEVYDITRPPFPEGGSSVRPQKSSSIPALQKASAYIEDSYSSRSSYGKLMVQAGIRLASLLNAPASMTKLRNKAFADPRINATWSFNQLNIAHTAISVSLHAGYGIQTKLPVLSQLYPNLNYFDIIELNYFSQNPKTRSLYIKTITKDGTNPNLAPARNNKVEVGTTIKTGNATLNITVFREKLSSGYASQTMFLAAPYTNYISTSVNPSEIAEPPTVDMFQSEADTMLLDYSTTVNGSLTIKKGVEYNLSLGRIKTLQTSITLNGAWFLSKYDISLPTYKRISRYYNNKPYPYVGIYTWNEAGKTKSLFNTNVLLDTHIPTYQLIVSTSLQFVWLETYQPNPNNGLPVAYITQNGEIHEYKEEYRNHPMLGLLAQEYSSRAFEKRTTPLNFSVNIRITKSIKKFMDISFYVNNIAYYQKPYKVLGTTQKKWEASSFGAEVNIKI